MKNQILTEEQLQQLYSLFLESDGICTDTRSIKPNQLFFALKGERFDGNRFASLALQKGALCAIVSDPTLSSQEGKLFFVQDTLQALSELAHFHRKQLATPLIMITGTNGKTTTKELTTQVLKKKFKVLATEGNLNNHIGVPLMLLRLSKSDKIAIIEAGASHEGEIAHLASIAAPNYGIITNIGRAHLEGFGSFEGVVRTKTELYRYLEAHQGSAFVHHSDALLCRHAKGLKTIFYGESQGDFISGTPLPQKEALYFSFTLSKGNQSIPVTTKLVGDYNLPNALAAAAVGSYFGISLEEIAEALASYTPSNHRSQLIPLTTLSNRLIVDVYNANPSSMKVAIDNFFSTTTALPRTLIIGDMLELGEASRQEHETLLLQVEEHTQMLSSAETYFVGREFASVKASSVLSSSHFFTDTEELLQHLKACPLTNHFILLKASHGLHLESILSAL